MDRGSSEKSPPADSTSRDGHADNTYSPEDTPDVTVSSSTKGVMKEDSSEVEADIFKPDIRFWLVLATLSLLVFLASLENSIIGTALPFIVEDLDIGSNYIWIAHIQLLTG